MIATESKKTSMRDRVSLVNFCTHDAAARDLCDSPSTFDLVVMSTTSVVQQNAATVLIDTLWGETHDTVER